MGLFNRKLRQKQRLRRGEVPGSNICTSSTRRSLASTSSKREEGGEEEKTVVALEQLSLSIDTDQAETLSSTQSSPEKISPISRLVRVLSLKPKDREVGPSTVSIAEGDGPWRQRVPKVNQRILKKTLQEYRIDNVRRILRACLPIEGADAQRHPSFQRIRDYAIRVEQGLIEEATSKENYDFMVKEKLERICEYLGEKRERRLRSEMGGQTSESDSPRSYSFSDRPSASRSSVRLDAAARTDVDLIQEIITSYVAKNIERSSPPSTS